MSQPVNPLAKFSRYQVQHVLLAFSNTEAACQYSFPPFFAGKCGDALTGLQSGSGYVIVNETKDPSYRIKDLVWSFDFFSPIASNTTISAGSFTIADARGNQFPSFLRRTAKRMGVAETRITFYLQTVFTGDVESTGTIEQYSSKPLIFQITDTASGFRDKVANLFTFNFVFLYNTVAQLPQYSALSQFTVTNSENSPARSVPSPSVVNKGIVSRAEEDRLRSRERSARMERSRPMRNLEQLFNGFQAELKEMRYAHRAQLQELMSIIRPSEKKKLKTPKPKRAKEGVGLPIDYNVEIDERFSQYPVDNRNLISEQTEIKQNSAGIESITLPAGSTIYSAVDDLMKTASNVGRDIRAGLGYKTVVSTEFDAEGVMRNSIRVNQYQIPRNKEGVIDTGDNADSRVRPFELKYMDGEESADVFSLSFASSPTVNFSILEDDADDIGEGKAFSSSQREQISFERSDTDDFMKDGYSGLRVTSDPVNGGLESSINGVAVDIHRHHMNIVQGTLSIAKIAGNPDLYSDLARNPRDVAEGRSSGARLFRYPEMHPMYLKLRVRIGKTPVSADKGQNDEEYWYHTYNYHLSGVTNSIIGGQFVQTLRLLSTDDAI